MSVMSRMCGSAVTPKLMFDVGQRVLERRDQVVDRAVESLDERRGNRAAGRR